MDTTKPTVTAQNKHQATHPRLRAILASTAAGLGAALAASLLSVLLMGILRLAAGIPTPVELFGDYALKHMDVGTFIRFLRTFAPTPKTTSLGLALLSMIGIGTLPGLLYAAIVRISLPTSGFRPTWREWLTALLFTVAMSATGILLFQDELRQNLFGLPINWSTFLTVFGLLADFTVYGTALAICYRALLPKRASHSSSIQLQKRRQLLSLVSVITLTAGAGAGIYGLIQAYLQKYTSYDGSGPFPKNGVTLPITPNDEHYTVTKNTIDPEPRSDLWRFEITGLLKSPGSYTYAEFQQLPATSRAITLECISNGVGSPRLMSTAIWQGVSLRTLLERHGGTLPGAKYVAFYSVDGYNVSLSLDEVLEADPLLAWRMNGEILPQRHGFPLRAVIPNFYGEESVKWLTRVEVTDHFVHGLYSLQGWYHGPLHPTSRIDRPRERVAVGQPVEIGGIAFSGNRGIQKVEVSTDGGTTWRIATLQPPLSKDCWVLWSTSWTPTGAAMYTLVVRATDGTGAVQTSQERGPVPNGATGYHRVKIEVKTSTE